MEIPTTSEGESTERQPWGVILLRDVILFKATVVVNESEDTALVQERGVINHPSSVALGANRSLVQDLISRHVRNADRHVFVRTSKTVAHKFAQDGIKGEVSLYMHGVAITRRSVGWAGHLGCCAIKGDDQRFERLVATYSRKHLRRSLVHSFPASVRRARKTRRSEGIKKNMSGR